MALTLTELDMVRQKLSTDWKHDWEQLHERVKPFMTQVTEVEGEYYESPFIGGTEMREYTGSRVKMEESRLHMDKRGMRYRKYYDYIEVSVDEQADMMNIETSWGLIKGKQKAAACRMTDMVALGVMKDKDTGLYRLKKATDGGFCGGILGINYGGEGGLVQKELDLTYPTENKRTNLIPVDYATTGTGVSHNFGGTLYDRIGYLKRILSELDAFDNTSPGDICVAISPAEKQLLSAYEVGLNKDYGFSKLNETGATYNEHLNVTFLVTNMLPKMDTVNKANVAVEGCTMCAAWLRSQVGFGTWDDASWTMKQVNNKVDVDYGLRVKGKCGAMRFRDDAVYVLPVISI